MAIDHVLAVVPVSDFDTAHEWYGRLVGRQADNLPMDGRLAEWRLTKSGWVQITTAGVRAGSAFVNLAVDDLESHVVELAQRGLEPGVIESVNKGVSLCPLRDPDGNTITFIGNFRVDY